MIIYIYTKERCQYCGYALGDTKDHIIPKSKVGSYKYRPYHNIVRACRNCNRNKSNILYIPSLRNIHDIYRNMDFVYIYYIAAFVLQNAKQLLSYQIYNYHLEFDWGSLGTITVYDYTRADIDEVIKLANMGYYDYMLAIWKDFDRYTGEQLINVVSII